VVAEAAAEPKRAAPMGMNDEIRRAGNVLVHLERGRWSLEALVDQAVPVAVLANRSLETIDDDLL
jgi:hypothetical protein